MFSLASLAFAVSQTLVGQWQFYKMHYQGQDYPPRDSNLVLVYSFHEDGKSHLKWTYTNDPRHTCEREGEYVVKDNVFYDRVKWVNPDNSIQCSGDSDMELGRQSVVPFDFDEGDLKIEIPFSGNTIYYIWKRLDKAETSLNEALSFTP